jgi:hypothetical protein
MIWRILRDRQVVVITESYGKMYYAWDTRSLEDVCQMCHKVHDLAYMMYKKKYNVHMLREDVRGICHRHCIYNDNDRCDMWDELSVPDETEKCDNQIDV